MGKLINNHQADDQKDELDNSFEKCGIQVDAKNLCGDGLNLPIGFFGCDHQHFFKFIKMLQHKPAPASNSR